MTDQPLLVQAFKLLQSALGFTAVIILQRHDAPDVIEIDVLQVHPAKGLFQVFANGRRFSAQAFRRHIKRPLFTGFVHLFKSDAEQFLRFAIVGCGIEIGDARLIGGAHQAGAGLHVSLIGEAHAAEPDDRHPFRPFAIVAIDHTSSTPPPGAVQTAGR
ncbi:MAG: hypothetical protein BWY83_03376 [bacterium ADurb.Bin478]|nr:MAG: hypothetical protein BWY83_03376 [bacterium ADurb.Bin478]